MYIPKSLNTCLHNYISGVRHMGGKIRLNIMVNEETYKKLLRYVYEKKTQGEKINISKTIERAIEQYLKESEQNE